MFHINLAYVFGILLPLLETLRRKNDFSNPWNYLDDYLVGILLIISARMAARNTKSGAAFLAGAWGILCGGLYYSFTSQLNVSVDVSGIPNNYVVLIKGAFFVLAIYCFVKSVKAERDRA